MKNRRSHLDLPCLVSHQKHSCVDCAAEPGRPSLGVSELSGLLLATVDLVKENISYYCNVLFLLEERSSSRVCVLQSVVSPLGIAFTTSSFRQMKYIYVSHIIYASFPLNSG